MLHRMECCMHTSSGTSVRSGAFDAAARAGSSGADGGGFLGAGFLRLATARLKACESVRSTWSTCSPQSRMNAFRVPLLELLPT
jgi:hypothetical protein